MVNQKTEVIIYSHDFILITSTTKNHSISCQFSKNFDFWRQRFGVLRKTLSSKICKWAEQYCSLAESHTIRICVLDTLYVMCVLFILGKIWGKKLWLRWQMMSVGKTSRQTGVILINYHWLHQISNWIWKAVFLGKVPQLCQ